MDAFEDHHLAVGLAVADDLAAVEDRQIHEQALDLPAVTDGFMLDVLAALAAMALRSKRRQADLDAALRHARIESAPGWRMAALERLRQLGFVDRVVELSDGGVLLSVTALGLDRLGGLRVR